MEKRFIHYTSTALVTLYNVWGIAVGRLKVYTKVPSPLILKLIRSQYVVIKLSGQGLSLNLRPEYS